MRILYAGTGYKPAYRLGGPITLVAASAEALVRKGHQVTVVATTANNDEELDVPTGVPVDVEGVEVWYFRRQEPLRELLPFLPYVSRSIGFLYSPEMRAALDRLVPSVDVVHTHGPFVYPSYAAARAAFRCRKPLVYSQQGCFGERRLRFRGIKKRLYIAAVERPIMRRAASLVALTEAEHTSYRALRVDTRVELIPNGVELPVPRADVAARIRARFGIAPKAPLVLFLGRLHPIKRPDLVLDSFLRVANDVPDAVLMMAGPDEWGVAQGWRNRYQDEVGEGRVLFPGMLEGDEKADVLARADLFVLPSLGEGFSLAALEALASSTAVMLSPGCNFPEVESAGAGVIVETDAEAMAQTLVVLLQDRARLHAMGEAGRRLATARYSWDILSEQLLSLYRESVVGA